MRAKIAEALKSAQKAQDKELVSTLRMISAAIQSRDIDNRGTGKEAASDDDILQILTKMVKQRQESAKAFEDGNRPELAAKENSEIVIINGFLPSQMNDDKMRAAISGTIKETGASGLRDMGKVMNALKEQYPGQMDFGKASGLVKGLLQ